MLTAAREPLIAIQQWPNINEACAFLAFSKSLRSGELRRFSIRKNKVKKSHTLILFGGSVVLLANGEIPRISVCQIRWRVWRE